MSEYQYYAFRAIDRSLTPHQLKELRALSTRARITPTSFVNEYHWGDFKGDPKKLMEQYFDFHFYFANWGTRILMLRVPQRLLDPAVAAAYCKGYVAETWVKGDNLLFDITSEEDPEYDEEIDEDYFQPMLGLRDELMLGDHRMLYLIWLLAVQAGEVDEQEPEPPLPPGLGDLTMAQAAFVDVMRLDKDLVWAAAERSGPLKPMASEKEIAAWVKTLPSGDKDGLLMRLVAGEAASLQAELLARYRSEKVPTAPHAKDGRTAGELLAAASARAENRANEEARRRAEAKAARERKEAAARVAHLDSLVGHEAALWKQVDDHIATRKPAEYDLAVKLLVDLRDLARRNGGEQATWARVAALREAHAKKPTLIERLDKAKLKPPQG